MCLYIRAESHALAPNRFPKPIVTDKPLFVWKHGCEKHRPKYRGGSYFKSWYREHHYNFGVMERSGTPRAHGWTRHGRLPRTFFVNEGLHAWQYDSTREVGRRFPAIIPAGSVIFVGSDDVVSNQLIVYRNMTELRNAFGMTSEQKFDSPITYNAGVGYATF